MLRSICIEAIENSDVDANDILRLVKKKEDIARDSLYTSMFSFENLEDNKDVDAMNLDISMVHSELQLMVKKDKDMLCLQMALSSELWDKNEVRGSVNEYIDTIHVCLFQESPSHIINEVL